MNNQEAFDKICNHLMTQKARAIGPTGMCVFRDAEGRKCAVGCLIPDELYTPDLESTPYPKHLMYKAPSVAAILDGVDLHLLRDCQCVHDHTQADKWLDALRIVATRYRLDTPRSIQ